MRVCSFVLFNHWNLASKCELFFFYTITTHAIHINLWCCISPLILLPFTYIYRNTNKTAYSLTKSSDIISKRIWWTRTHTRLFKKENKNVWHFLCFGLVGIQADNHYPGCRTEETTKRTKANITFIIRSLVVVVALWHDIHSAHEWRNDESMKHDMSIGKCDVIISSIHPSIHLSYSSPNSNSQFSIHTTCNA